MLSGAGLVLALGLGALPLSHWGETYSGLGRLWGGEVLWWGAGLVVLAYVIAAERRPLTFIGFRTPCWRDVGWGLIFGVALVVVVVVLDGIVLPALQLAINAASYKAIIDAPLFSGWDHPSSNDT